MKLRWNTLLQGLLIFAQVGNQISETIPEDAKVPVLGCVAIAQGAIAIIAHFVNPDGTIAKLAYTPPQNKKKFKIF